MRQRWTPFDFYFSKFLYCFVVRFSCASYQQTRVCILLSMGGLLTIYNLGPASTRAVDDHSPLGLDVVSIGHDHGYSPQLLTVDNLGSASPTDAVLSHRSTAPCFMSHRSRQPAIWRYVSCCPWTRYSALICCRLLPTTA